MAVDVLSGFHQLRADVVVASSTVGVATISSTAPAILSIAPWGDEPETCSRLDDRALDNCPITQPFTIGLIADPDTVFNWEPPDQSDWRLQVRLAGVELNCTESKFERGYPCMICTVLPRLGQLLPLTIQQAGFPLQSQPVPISFRSCPAGTYNNLTAVNTDLCLPCPAGSSSSANSYQCEVCHPGRYASSTGSAECVLCEAGSYMAEHNATQCLPCPLNSQTSVNGSTSCEMCAAGTYIVYTSDRLSNSSREQGKCVPCPDGAVCYSNGSIVAESGAFLLVDQRSNTVSSVSCSSMACLQGDACESTGAESQQLIARSQLPVINCCADGRYPAFDPSNTALAETGGVSVPVRCLSAWLYFGQRSLHTVCRGAVGSADRQAVTGAGARVRSASTATRLEWVSTGRHRQLLPAAEHAVRSE